MVKIFYFYSDFVQAVDNWRRDNLSRDNEKAAKDAITNFNPN